MAVLLEAPYSQLFDANGNPLTGGKVYTYAAGTTTPKATYTDAAESAQASNPIILDAAGRAEIWVTGSYNFKVTTAADVEIRTTPNYSAYTAGGDMTKAVYDPANIAQQVVGLSAVQTLTNKSGATAAIGTNDIGLATNAFATRSGGTFATGSLSVTSNTTLANVTGVTYTFAAGATYQFRIYGSVTSGSTGGWKLGVATTSAFTAFQAFGYTDNANAFVGTGQGISGPGTLVAGAFTGGAHFLYEGYFVANLAGTFTLQFAQNTSNATPSVLNFAAMQINQTA